MIFPEAGRSLDGRVQRFRAGAFRLACSLGVPVMPVTIVGGHECWPPGRRAAAAGATHDRLPSGRRASVRPST